MRAFDAYRRSYSVEVRPDRVLDLLVTDPQLPGSLYRSLESLASELGAIGPGPDVRSGAAAARLAGRLCALIRYEWPDRADRADRVDRPDRADRVDRPDRADRPDRVDRPDRAPLLPQVREHCFKLHDLVNAAYIDYHPGDAPVR